MEFINGDIVGYALVSCAVAALAFGIVTLDGLLVAVSAVASLVSLLVLKMWPALESLFIKRTNIIQVLNGFELGNEREAAIAVTPDGHTATCAARIDSFSGVELGRERLEAIVAHTGAPFRFVMQVEKLDAKGITERFETRKRMREIELSRLPNQDSGRQVIKAQRLKNDISRIEHDIAAVSSGLPLRLSAYMMTSAAAPERRVANDAARMQVRALATELGAIGIACSILTGGELLSLLRFDATVSH